MPAGRPVPRGFREAHDDEIRLAPRIRNGLETVRCWRHSICNIPAGMPTVGDTERLWGDNHAEVRHETEKFIRAFG